MLIDTYMPVFDKRHYHEKRVAADPASAYAALRNLDFQRSWIVRALLTIRSLASKNRNRKPDAPARSFLQSAVAMGWKILAEDPGRELVAGAATQPWAATVVFHGVPPPEFLTFSQPGFTKIAWNIAARPSPAGGTVVSTETRVLATDAQSRRRFRRYWFFVNPGIRLIRWIALARLQRELKQSTFRSVA